jgi:hypothetical protein
VPRVLALGLGTVCVVAAVLLLVNGYTAAGVVALSAGAAFDLLLVKALVARRV